MPAGGSGHAKAQARAVTPDLVWSPATCRLTNPRARWGASQALLSPGLTDRLGGRADTKSGSPGQRRLRHGPPTAHSLKAGPSRQRPAGTPSGPLSRDPWTSRCEVRARLGHLSVRHEVSQGVNGSAVSFPRPTRPKPPPCPRPVALWGLAGGSPVSTGLTRASASSPGQGGLCPPHRLLSPGTSSPEHAVSQAPDREQGLHGSERPSQNGWYTHRRSPLAKSGHRGAESGREEERRDAEQGRGCFHTRPTAAGERAPAPEPWAWGFSGLGPRRPKRPREPGARHV